MKPTTEKGGVDAHKEVLEEFVVQASHADGFVKLLVDGDGHAEALALFEDGPEFFLVGPLALELAGDVGAAEGRGLRRGGVLRRPC